VLLTNDVSCPTSGIHATVYISGSLISLVRLQLGESGALHEILWAENGLFPLCVRNYGVWECLWSPYSGSLKSTIPKGIASLVAPWPLEVWPIVANLVAAVLGGLLVVLTFVVVRISGGSLPLAAALSMTLVLHPSLGTESINSTAHLYIPVAYVVTLVLFLPSALSRLPLTAIFVVVSGGVLTMPPLTLVVVLGYCLDQSRRVNAKRWIVSGASALIALLVEFVGRSIDRDSRATQFKFSSLGDWLRQLPLNLVESLVGDQPAEEIAFLYERKAFWVGVAISVVVVVSLLARSRISQVLRVPLGLLAAGMILSLVPGLAYGVIDRYFVWLQLAAAAACIYLLFAATQRGALRAIVLVGLWAVWLFGGSFAAAEIRVSENYHWSSYLSVASEYCQTTNAETAEILFAPDWPLASDTKAQATGVHSNRIRCSDLTQYGAKDDSGPSMFGD